MQRRSQCVSYDLQSGDCRPGSLQVIDYGKVMNRPEQPHRDYCDTSFGKSMCIQFAIVTQYIALRRYDHRPGEVSQENASMGPASENAAFGTPTTR
jgi:hypothetical protein